MRLLFICGRNRMRSPTAEALFDGHEQVQTLSAGVNPDADVPVSVELIDWADRIYVMERTHRDALNARFGKALSGKRVTCLGIPDRYEYMQPQLIEVLRHKLAHLLG
ncbi:phosphotyrosine protein phosphatase [Schlegelella sp. S2-27]|uniref:Phosphotyrosine protein phosphatase n=1 Tax=Caldimonas mangrovi TaxID=2944811 RepID=A0ABT0YU93_9BURK|nr:phosphotyrosine protein phosphatase [Caldimonas mangrovi]MCM5682325.1 phosphotyrosine protein phosphatase [Caldimonas mangrovi]